MTLACPVVPVYLASSHASQSSNSLLHMLRKMISFSFYIYLTGTAHKDKYVKFSLEETVARRHCEVRLAAWRDKVLCAVMAGVRGTRLPRKSRALHVLTKSYISRPASPKN